MKKNKTAQGEGKAGKGKRAGKAATAGQGATQETSPEVLAGVLAGGAQEQAAPSAEVLAGVLEGGSPQDEKSSGNDENVVDKSESSVLQFPQSTSSQPMTAGEEVSGTQAQNKESAVKLTLKGLSNSKRDAIYAGAAQSVRFAVANFPDKTPPAEIEVDFLVGAAPKVDRAKETPEERKARLANAPKPTLAEKVKRAQERAAKLQAKLDAEAAAAAKPAL